MERQPSVSDSQDLRARRLRVGLSQRGLAAIAGVSVSTVRLAEHSWRPGQSDALERIEKVLAEHEAIKQAVP
jgi:predicted transcriptional regulator